MNIFLGTFRYRPIFFNSESTSAPIYRLLFVSCNSMRALILILSLFSVVSFSQELKPEGTYKLNVDQFIGVDSYQHTYYIDDQVLHKKGPLGDYVFNNYQLGSISSVDIINPLKVLVFYKEVNTAIFLDNRLNEIERINFDTLPEFLNVGAASNAGNNLLWVFDIDSQQLQLFDYRNNRKTIVSQPFTGDIKSLASGFTYCHVLTEDGLFTFNVYGSFISERDAAGFQKISQHGGNLVALKDNTIFYLKVNNENGDENSVVPLKWKDVEITVKDLQLTQDFLYIYDGNLVHTFTLTQPK